MHACTYFMKGVLSKLLYIHLKIGFLKARPSACQCSEVIKMSSFEFHLMCTAWCLKLNGSRPCTYNIRMYIDAETFDPKKPMYLYLKNQCICINIVLNQEEEHYGVA